MERRLAAILAADVVGYARLMGIAESETVQRLTSTRIELLEPLIARHRGRIVKLMGDGLLVEFPSIVDAVLCATSWQDAVTEQEAVNDTETRIRYRIGVNVGDIIAQGDDIYGDGVNIAARLEQSAEPGGICISDSAYQQVRGKIPVDTVDLGELSLKNIADPVRVHRIVNKGGEGAGFTESRLASHLEKPSIAVLAFDNMSKDMNQDFFSDGITEDIITALSRFSELIVIARNSSFAYKGKSIDIRQIAKELGVRYVLEGSVRRVDSRVRITAQLIDSDRGNHVWAENFDRDIADILDLQEEITRNVAANIAPQIEFAELERSRRLSGTGLTAYEQSLGGLAQFYDSIRVSSPEFLRQAMATAESALQSDPHCSHALWILGTALMYQHLYRWGDDPDGALTKVEEIADRFLIVDSLNPRAHLMRAWGRQFRQDYDAAIDSYRRALELNPNFAISLFSMSWGEAVAGLFEEAKEHATLGLRLSPRDTDMWLGEAYLALTQASFGEGRFDETLKWGRLAIQTNSTAPIRRALMIASHGHLGQRGSVQTHAAVLAKYFPDFLAALFAGRYKAYRLAPHNELLLEGLRKAGVSA